MIAGDNDTDGKFSPLSTTRWTIIAGDNSTGDKFFAGINVTGEQLSPVTTTPVIKFFAGVGDTGQK